MGQETVNSTAGIQRSLLTVQKRRNNMQEIGKNRLKIVKVKKCRHCIVALDFAGGGMRNQNPLKGLRVETP